MKKILILLTPLLLLLHSCGGESGGIPESWKTYEIKSQHIQFRYPDNWLKRDYPDAELPAFFYEEGKKDAPFPPTLNVSSDPLFVNKTVDEYWTNQKATIERVYNAVDWKREENVTRLGTESREVEYTLKFQGQDLHSHMLMIPREKVMMIWEFLAPETDWENHAENVKKVFGSIGAMEK